MLRNRNVFLNDFFSATGEIATPTSPAPAPTPTQTPEVTPIAPSLSDGGGTTAPIKPMPTVYPTPIHHPQSYAYPIVYPRISGYPVIIEEPVYIIPNENDVVMNPSISTGGGGGFGNGAMSEEEIIGGESGAGDGIKMAQPKDDGKKKILWLILIAIALYFGYRYWKKNK